MQYGLGMPDFREQQYTMIFNTKHAHYLQGVGDKARELSICVKQETWTLNLLKTEDQWVPSANVMVLLHCKYQKAKKKFERLYEEQHG